MFVRKVNIGTLTHVWQMYIEAKAYCEAKETFYIALFGTSRLQLNFIGLH